MFEGMTCLYKSNVDLYFYVIGSGNIKLLLDIKTSFCFVKAKLIELGAIYLIYYFLKTFEILD